MNNITKRRTAISKLISQEKIDTQHDLITLLKNQFGIETNQAVISRDLKALNVVKKAIDGKRVFSLPARDVHEEVLKLGVQDIQKNEALIVVTVLEGLAPFVGDIIDDLSLDILGTLAGENTIFITPKSTHIIDEVYKQICKELYFNPFI
ncbi:MAG: Arginine repressor [Chlamydiia bacterium]|nr:Arginine repressor [Chlamydiia bacterium]